jgi:hypothetical protein
VSSRLSNAAVGRAMHGTVGCNLLDEARMSSFKVQPTSEPEHDERRVSATADIHASISNGGSQSQAGVRVLRDKLSGWRRP